MTITSIKTALTAILGITSWNSIQYILKPADDPIGYIQLSEASHAIALSTYIYSVAIGVADLTLDGLNAEIDTLIGLLKDAFITGSYCTSAGSIELDSSIFIAEIDSYPQDSYLTETSGFKTGIAFRIKLTN